MPSIPSISLRRGDADARIISGERFSRGAETFLDSFLFRDTTEYVGGGDNADDGRYIEFKYTSERQLYDS
jgi:hypothetical protein